MHVLLIVIGLILAVFGGGCVLIVGGLIISDPQSMTSDPMSILGLGGGLGALPLVIGLLLFRWGLKIDREKRKAGLAVVQDQQK
jgi:hypothetical protein